MPTVGQILDQTSKLRSHIAIIETLSQHLRANYLSNDAGGPDMRFQRSDFGLVPQDHIEDYLAELQQQLEECQGRLLEWERLPVVTGEEQIKAKAPLALKKKGMKNAGTRSGSGDPSASQSGGT